MLNSGLEPVNVFCMLVVMIGDRPVRDPPEILNLGGDDLLTVWGYGRLQSTSQNGDVFR